MKNHDHYTQVIFRKFKDGDVIAVFPAEPGTHRWWEDCSSYQHIGQHGACSISISEMTEPAKPEDYVALYRELIRLGYRLRVIKRFTANHRKERKQQIERSSRS